MKTIPYYFQNKLVLLVDKEFAESRLRDQKAYLNKINHQVRIGELDEDRHKLLSKSAHAIEYYWTEILLQFNS